MVKRSNLSIIIIIIVIIIIIIIIITVFKNHDIDQIQACVTDTDCELVSAERGLDYKCFQYMSVLTFVRIVFKNDHMFILSISR